MTTTAKRAKKKANRAAKLERLALILEGIDALADLSEEEVAEATVTHERPESEKAAAMQLLTTIRNMRKK